MDDELYFEMLIAALVKENMHLTFPDFKLGPDKVIRLSCHQTVEKIKAILNDDSLTDAECFARIDGLAESPVNTPVNTGKGVIFRQS